MTEISKEREHASIGVALGGGAARGAAHIGVLKALQEHGAKPDFITGTSIGALIGGLYAFGVDLNDLRESAAKLRWMDMAGATLSRFGLLSNSEMGKLVERFVGDQRLEDAPIPFAALATDIHTGEAVVIKEGRLIDAIVASTAIPGIFVPSQQNGRMLVDGGLVENVPLSPLKAMGAEVLVAVDINGARRYDKPENVVDVILNAMDIAIDTTTQTQLKTADVLISLDLTKYARTDGSDVRELVAEGYRGGVLSLKQLDQVLSHRKPSSWQVLENTFRAWREAID
ncbi:MAG: patatin-like phospholipase family protein [Oceanococcus sp.]